MEKQTALRRLSALSHAGRLDVFRCLVRAAPDGLPAGILADRVNTPANTLSAQLNILSVAKLVSSERHGRSITYRADLGALNSLVLYLIEDCCDARDEVCEPILQALQSSSC